MDYFSEEGRVHQRCFAKTRDRIFSPIINRLLALGVTPNQVSIVGVCFLLLVCGMSSSFAIPATACVAMYVFCDGLDGPLARRLGVAHAGGSLVDIVADQLGVVFLSAAAIYHLGAWGPVMVVFACAYLIFIGLVVYANGLKVELRIFVRSKYVFFILYLWSLYLGKDLVTYFCAAFALYYSVESFEALRRIYLFHDAQSKASRDADMNT